MCSVIHVGDARELSQSIGAETVDLIFTDPVYANVEDYWWLAKTAVRVLKPGGACLAWCSKPQEAACREAENVLMNQSLFMLDNDAYAAFEDALARPLADPDNLRRLRNHQAPWDK